MTAVRGMLLALSVAGLCACTDDTGDETDGLLETQQQAIERAEDVEEDMLEAARRQREQIEEQGGDG